MKPFNLEEAKAGKPVCTRDGRPVRILCFDLKNNTFPIAATIETAHSEEVFIFTLDGKYNTNRDSYLDLFMAVEKKTGWINIYKDKNYNRCSSIIYSDEEMAKNFKGNTISNSYSYIDTIQITWEE